MQILIWCKQTFLYLHFCYCSAERRLAERYKRKREEIIVWRLLKGHRTTKKRWLRFSLREEKVTFVMSGDEGDGRQMPRRPRTIASVLQMYGSVVPWGCADSFSLCVCGWITDQAGDTLWQQIPEHKWANGRRTWKDEPNLHLVLGALLYYSLRGIVMEHNPAFSPLLLQTICSAI